MDAHRDQLPQPALRNQLDIALADTGRSADNELVAAAILQPGQCPVVHVQLAAALVADNFVAFDADQRRNVAQPAQLARHRIGDQLAVREHLEIAVAMRGEDIEQLRMHERLAAQDTEIAIAVLLCVLHDPVHVRQRDPLSWRFHVHPAALAAQVAAVGDRDVEEGREGDALLEPRLELLDRAHALVAEVVADFPEQAQVR